MIMVQMNEQVIDYTLGISFPTANWLQLIINYNIRTSSEVCFASTKHNGP